MFLSHSLWLFRTGLKSLVSGGVDYGFGFTALVRSHSAISGLQRFRRFVMIICAIQDRDLAKTTPNGS